jgi:predicted nucleic-acid-binding protein
MKTAIKIGNKESKKKVKHIISILDAINKNITSDDVAIQALKTYTKVSKLENITISGCTISNN